MVEEEEKEIYRSYIKAIATLNNLNFSDERVQELIPIIKRYFDLVPQLDVLDYTGVEPATIFLPQPARLR